ncbi:MAG: metallophosphoesterase [Chloroflexi bacterium]|nr:metallophosphoesterase [Chloroflexota bacterium]
MTFSFIQITDHHLPESESILTKGYSTWFAFRAVLRHIAEHRADVDFIVSTGDLVDKGTDAEYQYVREQLGIHETSAPPGPQRVSIEGLREMLMYFLPGNHDTREDFFRNMFPSSDLRALNIAFTHKGVQFVCIDWGAANKAVASEGMFEFLERALKNDAPSIILTHHHVTPMGMAYVDAFLADNLDEFARIITGRKVLAIFNGHTHATFEAQLAGVPVYGLRSTTFSFVQQGDELLYVLRSPHYRVVTVEDGKVSTAIVEVTL